MSRKHKTQDITKSVKSKRTGGLSDIVELKSLAKELLAAGDRCSQAPYYIVQPFLGIVKKHSAIIGKFDLLK